MSFFLDTSALAKIYHDEKGTDIMHALYHGQEVIYLSALTQVEFRSMVLRLHREQLLRDKALEAVLARFLCDLRQRYQVLPFSMNIIHESERLLDAIGRTATIRTLDTLQLAFYSAFREKDTIFVCADHRLLDAAEKQHFPTMNPAASAIHE